MARRRTKKKFSLNVVKNVKRNPKLFWVYLVIVLIILYVIIYIVPSITGAFKTTYTATYGEVEIGDETEIYIARDEDVYLADDSGTIKVYCKEGDMVKKGSRIGEIKASQDDEKGSILESDYYQVIKNNKKKVLKRKTGGICQRSGVYSEYVDGFESLLNPKRITKIKEADLEDVSQKKVMQAPSKKIKAGEPMFKVVSNARWYVLCFLDNKAAKKYDEYSHFKVIIDEEEVGVFLYKKLKRAGGKTLVIFQSNRYYDKFTMLRKADAKIVSYTRSGILLSNDSIKKVKGKKGVYVKDKWGEFKFRPIKVIAVQGDTTIVEKSYYYDDKGEYVETVCNYDQVLK